MHKTDNILTIHRNQNVQEKNRIEYKKWKDKIYNFNSDSEFNIIILKIKRTHKMFISWKLSNPNMIAC
jgi:hypothetical protein